MPSPRAFFAAVAAAALVAAGCGSARKAPPPTLPLSVHLSAEERAVWTPLPVTRAGIPVLLYHGIGERDDFNSPADAAYGVTQPNFAKQMALLRAAGYQTITIEQFRGYLAGEPVTLPPRPLLLTFDDSLANSFEGADPVLRQLGWTAVMFVDVGSVDEHEKRYASWEQLGVAQRSGRWELQLHSGHGHHNIPYDAEGTMGPFYANRLLARESLADWERRIVRDLDWGQTTLRKHVPSYRPLSWAPPYGNFGQVATDDPAIPSRLGAIARGRYGVVFVQQPARYARVGDTVVPRLQITRKMSGGDLHAWLAQQLPGRMS
jgi:peptidoglycan/xylan/chitin deacetylase (PgdA/CDA1 family)